MTTQVHPKPLLEDRTFLRHFWHPVCTREELETAHPSGRGPLAVTLLGNRLAIAKLGGKIVAMDDRCAHRFAALSKGTVIDDTIRCNYHGWRYDSSGKTVHIPACPELPIPRKAATNSLWGVKQGAVDLVGLADDVPAQARAKLEEVKSGLRSGSFAIWSGPIQDQSGKEVLASKVEATDKFLDGMNFLVKGVEGKLPTR